MINHKPETYNPNTAKNFNLHNPDVDYAKLGEQCLEQIPLIDVYRGLVGGKEEKPSSDNIKVQCCFHDDSHPSLSISLSKNLYHCFACGAKGNLIDFVKEVKKCDYKEAVDWLAEFGGLHIPQRVRPAPTKISPKVPRKSGAKRMGNPRTQRQKREGRTQATQETCEAQNHPEHG